MGGVKSMLEMHLKINAINVSLRSPTHATKNIYTDKKGDKLTGLCPNYLNSEVQIAAKCGQNFRNFYCKIMI